VASRGPRAALRDVGDWLVREGNDGVRWPLGRGGRWASLGRLGRPAPQDAPCSARVVDERNGHIGASPRGIPAPSQIASEAIEKALEELEDRLPFASDRDENEALSLKAMAYVRRHTSRG
jgi:hypothetical protein